VDDPAKAGLVTEALEDAEPPSSGVSLGKLSPADRARVAAILRATRVFRDDEIGVALEVFDEGLGTRPSPDYEFLGAFTTDAGLVGYTCYGATPDTDGTYDLYWIAVDPAVQGTGVGTLLLAELERRLRRRRARMLVVETSSRADYVPTRAFYERCGYREAARAREFYAPGDDRIIYSKTFGDPGATGVETR
jgi:ribosomal protein S18 acetylase RimI-like enzyme